MGLVVTMTMGQVVTLLLDKTSMECNQSTLFLRFWTQIHHICVFKNNKNFEMLFIFIFEGGGQFRFSDA